MADISPRQQRILDYIERFIAEKDYPPSIRNIQMACQVSSTSVVDYNLNILERQGLIRRDREVSRGIEVMGHLIHDHSVEGPVREVKLRQQPLL